MKKSFSLIACLMVVTLVTPSFTGRYQKVGAWSDSNGGAVSVQSLSDSAAPVAAIVELESEPVVRRKAGQTSVLLHSQNVDFESAAAQSIEAQIEAEQDEFRARASLISPNLRVNTRLRKLANAISIEVPGRDLAAIAALPNVRRVELVKEYRADLASSVSLVGARLAWEKLGGSAVAGQGVRIAILDTGIDVRNPLFSDTGFNAPDGFPRSNNGSEGLTNNKVIVAKSFVTSGNNPTALDENGHGTNVAGIAAGRLDSPSPLGDISGVAPKAYLGNYRVLGRTGSGRSDLIASALEEAVADGMDVINLSLGSAAGSQLDFLARAVEAAVAVGKVLVVSAGNSGEGGVDDAMTIGTPGISPNAITVAATSNAHVVGPTVTVANVGDVPAELSNIASIEGQLGDTPVSVPNTTLPYVEVNSQSQGRACGTLPAGSLSGKVALIERGNCSFAAKINAAAAAGAAAVVIYNQPSSENSENGGDAFVFMDVTGTNIPSVFITNSSGVALRNFVRANPGASLHLAALGAGKVASDVVASFSSRGPSSLGALKPDVAAPGVSIYSGAIRTNNADGVSDASGFLAVSGTSQAAPHVAGAAAIIKQLHPSWSPAQVKSALMNSAVDGFTTSGKTATSGVLATGAGRINLDRAVSVGATFSPASLSFGINKFKKQTVTITGDLNITSQLDGQNNFAVSVQQLDPDARFTITQSATSVLLAAGESKTVTFTLTIIKKAERRDYTGYVLVTDPFGQTLRVPFWVKYAKKV